MASPPSAEERRGLVEKNLNYVRALASEIARRVPPEVELDDLVGYGHQGLIEAAERFDPTRGASFATFAYYRIRGAIFDGLRKMAWFRRREYAELRFESRADDLLGAAAAGEAALRAERPGEPALRAEVVNLSEAIEDLSVVFVATLEGFEATARALPPDEAADARLRLRRALDKLPEREREVVRLCYLEDESLQEAGRRMKLSRSWVSRIHSRAVRLLREDLAAP